MYRSDQLLNLKFKFQTISGDKAEPRIFSDDDISSIVDFAIKSMDKNSDGLIEFPEFIIGEPNYN